MSKPGPAPKAIWIDKDLDERGNLVAFVKSTTRPRLWHPIVVSREGYFMCGCEDFVYRHGKYRPMLRDGVLCRHGESFRFHLLAHARELFRRNSHAA